jgi:hypothetical protein
MTKQRSQGKQMDTSILKDEVSPKELSTTYKPKKKSDDSSDKLNTRLFVNQRARKPNSMFCLTPTTSEYYSKQAML